MINGLIFPFTVPGLISDPVAFFIGSAQFTVGTQYSGKSFKGSLEDSQGYQGSFFKSPVSGEYVPEWPAWNPVDSIGGLRLVPTYLDLSPALINNLPNPNYLGNILLHKTAGEYDLAIQLEWFENGININTIDPHGKLFAVDSSTRGLIVKGNRWEDNTIDGTFYPKVSSRQLVYTLKFTYLDPVKSAYVQNYYGTDVEISHTLKLQENGEDSDYIVITPRTSQVFNQPNPDDTLIFDAKVYLEGALCSDIEKVKNISWAYYDPQHVINDGWVTIPIVPGSDCDYFSISVRAGDFLKARTFRYKATLDDIERQDTIVIRKETSDPRIKVISKAGDKYKSAEDLNTVKSLTAQVTVNKHGKWEQLPENSSELNRFTFTWRKFDDESVEVIGDGWPKTGNGLHTIQVTRGEITNFNVIVVELAESFENRTWYGVTRALTQQSPDLTRIGQAEYHRSLPLHEAVRPCIVNSDGSINYWLDKNDITRKENGSPSDLTGKDGQVCVCFPATYSILHGIGVASGGNKDTTAVGFAPFSIDGDIAKFFPSFIVSMDYVTNNKQLNRLEAVFNYTQNYAGSSGAGTPICGLTSSEMITKSKALGANWLPSFYYAEQIVTAFMTIEFATYNLKKPINRQKTPEGFTQGGLGTGAANWTSEQWAFYNGRTPVIRMGEVQKALSEEGGTKGTGEVSQRFTVGANTIDTKFNCWRWISNPWGYIQKATVGGLLKTTEANAPMKFYMTKKPGNITENTPLIQYDLIGEVPRTSGFISRLYPGTNMPIALEASSSTGVCGYWKSDPVNDKENRLLFEGNTLDSGEFALRNTTDARLGFLFPYNTGDETVNLYSTGLFTLLKQ